MVKNISLILVFVIALNANFKNNCVNCHIKVKVDLRETFMNALLVYGAKNSFKTALFYYCKNPASMTSVMNEWYLNDHKIPNPVKLDDATLKKMLNIYWNRYKVINNLK